MALPSQSVTAREFDPAGSGARVSPWSMHLVVLALGGERLGVDLRRVREIIPCPTPDGPARDTTPREFVIEARGRAIQVHDLAPSYGAPSTPRLTATRIVIVDVADRVHAFLADHVIEVVRVDPGVASRCHASETLLLPSGPIRLLNLDAVFASPGAAAFAA